MSEHGEEAVVATTIRHKRTRVGTAGEDVPRAALGAAGQPMAARLTTERVWHQVVNASFAILSYLTPAGEPRSSGVMHASIGRRLYVAVAPDSWKARHIAACGRVAVTVPVRRGGLLSLVAPIPPATISFHAAAIVQRGGIRLAAEPGTRYTYSSDGFATLGQIVEDVSGTPFDRYLRGRIFEPLGMADTDLLRSDRVKARLATGYELGSKGAGAVDDRELITAGGGAIFSTPRDMARYVAALLGGGANEHGSVLRPETLATMFEPQYQPDARIPGMGLAFSRVDVGGHLAVEHGGILPGLTSQIFIAPDDGVGVIAFTNGARLAMLWLPGEVVGLLRHTLGVPDEVIRTDVPHHPEVWGEICGWYRLAGRLTDARARLAIGAGAEVFVRGGRLMLRGLSPVPAVYKGFPLHPDDDDDPYVFRMDLSEFGLGTARVVFSPEPGGGISELHIDFFLPSLEQRLAATNPRLWVNAAVAVAMTATAVRRHRSRHKGVRI
jgi:hypothetical protein